MSKLNSEIIKYNKNISFFNKSKKIKKEFGDIYVGQSNIDNTPQILKRETTLTIVFLGDLIKIKEQYKELLLQQIEYNESFIFINDVFEDTQYLDDLKNQILKCGYNYDIVINDFDHLMSKNINTDLFSYIIDIKNNSMNKDELIQLINLEILPNLLRNLVVKGLNFYTKKHKSLIVASPRIIINAFNYSMFRSISYSCMTYSENLDAQILANSLYLVYFKDNNINLFNDIKHRYLYGNKPWDSYIINLADPEKTIRIR